MSSQDEMKMAPKLTSRPRAMWGRGLSSALCALALVLWPVVLAGQEGETVTGIVKAQNGGPVSAAKVTLVNSDANTRQEAVTGEDGSFSFKNVPPGNYLLQVKASPFEAFQTTMQVGLTETAKLAMLRITLKLQTVEEEVVVRPDPGDDRLSPETNMDSIKVDGSFFTGLPLEIDYLQSFIDTFKLPAVEGSEGPAIVVDGAEGGELDMPTTAIRSVRINRNPYSAEFQQPGGARAEIHTKHGNNRHYEGTMAFFVRNSALDAKDAFAESKPDLQRRFLETSVGGPLPWMLSRGSFYLAGQRLMDDRSAVVNSVDTVALTGPLNINVLDPQRRDHLFARAQLLLTEMHSVSVNYTFSDQSSTNNDVGALTLPQQGFSASRHTHRAQFLDSVAFSPQLRNEALFLFKDQESRTGGPPSGPEIVVNGAFIGGPSQAFDSKDMRGFVAQDTVTYIRGKHNLVFGAAFRNDWWNAFEATNFGGTFTFSSLDQYRNVVQNHVGTPDLFQINQGGPSVSFYTQQTSAYVQDTMRVLPGFSATFGLRYDWQKTLDDRRNLAPRLSLAYAPGQRKRTVIRAGAGIFYDNLPRSATQDALLFNGMRLSEIDVSHPSYPDPFLAGQLALPPPSISSISPNAQAPCLIQASAGVEEEVWKGSWMSLEYLFVHGVHLFRVRDVNAPLPSTGLRPDPSLSNNEQVESTAFLRGHALTVTFRGGWGKRFKGYGQYVLSEFTNDVSTAGPGVFLLPADNYNLRPEIGPADFDHRHRVNFAGTMQLPLGFHFGTILSVATGAPFNITTGSDPNGNTVSRPPGVTRNTGRGPGTLQLDVRLSKVFLLDHRPGAEKRHSKRSVELGVDAFNATNHLNAASIIGVVSSPLFGQPDAANSARTIQLSAKYSF